MGPQKPPTAVMNVAEVRPEFHEMRVRTRGLREANMALRSELAENLAGLEDLLARTRAYIDRC